MNLMADAVEQGKVRAVGVSNYSADQMRLAHRVLADRGIPLASNQVEYSLLHRQPETDGVLDACRELGVTLIANQPLANGALTGKFVAGARPSGFRRFMPRFRGKQREAVAPVVALLREIGDAHGRSPAQVALRWLIENELVLPIPGAKNGRQAADNAGALAFSLTPAEIEALDRATPPGAARKERHREARTPDLFVHLARRTRGDRPDPRALRQDRRRGRLRLHLGHGPLLADRPARLRAPADAGGLDDPRLHGRPQPARPARADGRRRPLPQPRAVGQGRHDARRPVGRPGVARHRRSLEPGRIRGSGLPVPAATDRFEMLEDTLRIAHGMWQGERGSEEAFHGRQFHATRLLNVPQSISRLRVPIMIGGGGERKTLRLVAQYADASNLFGGPDQLVLEVRDPGRALRGGRSRLHEIERTNMQGVGLGSAGAWSRTPESPEAIVERFGRLAEAGVQHVIINFAEANDPALIELLGSRVLPQLREIEAADPRQLAAIG